MIYVYLVECSDGTLYTGITPHLKKRIQLHDAGKGAKYTRGRGPVQLRYVEVQTDRSAALRREREIKRLTRAQKWQLVERVCLLRME